MKALRTILLALAAAAALVTSSLATVSTDPTKTASGQIRDIGNYAFGSLPAASANTNFEALATDLGANGTKLRSNGTRWLAANGAAVLKGLGAPVSGIANTETIVLQTQIPAGAWQTNDTLRVWLTLGKSGSTNSSLVSVRVGTAGTTSDTAITGLSSLVVLGATGLSGGAIFDVKLLSATSAQKVGNSATVSSAYGGPSTVAVAAATTITDASANALFVTVTIASSGATDTVSIQSGQIQLITP